MFFPADAARGARTAFFVIPRQREHLGASPPERGRRRILFEADARIERTRAQLD